MVTPSSFSLELKKNGLLLRKNSWRVLRWRWQLPKDSAENKPKNAAPNTHTEDRTPGGRNQGCLLFPKEPIGTQPWSWLPSVPSGQEVRGPPEKRRCNSQHAVLKRHTLALPQETFCLYFCFSLQSLPPVGGISTFWVLRETGCLRCLLQVSLL